MYRRQPITKSNGLAVNYFNSNPNVVHPSDIQNQVTSTEELY